MEIQASGSIPYYNSDFKKGLITLKGVSINDDVKDFYTSIINDLKMNLGNVKKNIKIEIDLTYFNTRTSRYLLDIFKTFIDLLIPNGYKVTVDWYYEEDDIDMCDTALDYQSLTGIPFNTISRKPTGIDGNDLDY